ncbi:MAG: right-handed parallel beta-helix repeat-containing protein [Clostridia bacterium]|nr:right-handed parallel beta-helix repeat-containing protein [Clostridia bacterium]
MNKKMKSVSILLIAVLLMAMTFSASAISATGTSTPAGTTAAGITDSGTTATAIGKTYYVSTSGSDSNSGLSLQAPFKTIQKSANTVKAGDTVFVRGGVYKESLTMKNSGTAAAPIQFKGYNGEKPVIDGTGRTVEAGVLIANKHYIKFIGFTVCNFISKNEDVIIGISVEGNSKGIEIRDCIVHDIKTTYSKTTMDRNAHGIAVYGTVPDSNDPIDGLILDNNEVYRCTLGLSEAVVLNGNVSNFRVTNNRVHDNDNIGIDFIGFEGTANDEEEGDSTAMQDRARNGICSGNRVWNISCATNPTYEGEGLCADGLYVDGGYNIIIERNIVNNCDIGIEAASEHYGCTTDRITIRNNVVKNCKGVGGISFGGADASENGDAKNIKIINNTLYNNVVQLNISNANSSTNSIRNNICYLGEFVSGKIGKNVISNNLTKNPYFVDEVAGDFRLKANSPAIDAGVAADYGTLDLAGNVRLKGKAVDLGAFELK